MTIRWDPKVGPVERTDAPQRTSATAPGGPTSASPEPAPKNLGTPGAPATHPGQKQLDSAPTAWEREVKDVRQALRGLPAERREAALRALTLCHRYPLRRSRGARTMALELCEEVAQQPELRSVARKLARLLAAEGELHLLDPQATAKASRAFAVILDEPAGGDPDLERTLRALALASLAQALIQLAIHFRADLEMAGLSLEDTLAHAVSLAEEAIALAPELPDGHAALGRALLCYDEPDALADALAALQHARDLDPHHDPTLAALAALHLAQGDLDNAQALANDLQRLGNALPQVIHLRGILFSERGQLAEARAEFERATRLAPNAGLLWRDRATVAQNPQEADAFAHRARELLGDDT